VNGANAVSGTFPFPGTYAVRPETLRAIFMDLGEDFGEQGFRWIFLMHMHGPRHITGLSTKPVSTFEIPTAVA
jgi:hypothetical protein